MPWTKPSPVRSNLPSCVARVNANAERKVLKNLPKRRIEILLPIRKRCSRQQNPGLVEILLFRGRIFACFSSFNFTLSRFMIADVARELLHNFDIRVAPFWVRKEG
jgi:hypothetical protein